MCASGRGSLPAPDYLMKRGYTDVASVCGGILAWRGAGLPVKGGGPAPGEGDLPPS